MNPMFMGTGINGFMGH